MGDAVSIVAPVLVPSSISLFISLTPSLCYQVHAMETHFGAGGGQAIEVRAPLSFPTHSKTQRERRL